MGKSAALVAFEHDVEAARFRLGDERFGFALILEAREVGLEAAAGIVAQLDARKTGSVCAVDDRLCRGAVPPVAENSLEPAEWLRLDALQCDGETFTTSLTLEVDSNVEGVDAANDDAKSVAALDDVRVHESA